MGRSVIRQGDFRTSSSLQKGVTDGGSSELDTRVFTLVGGQISLVVGNRGWLIQVEFQWYVSAKMSSGGPMVGALRLWGQWGRFAPIATPIRTELRPMQHTTPILEATTQHNPHQATVMHSTAQHTALTKHSIQTPNCLQLITSGSCDPAPQKRKHQSGAPTPKCAFG